jgi:hypothetical protein
VRSPPRSTRPGPRRASQRAWDDHDLEWAGRGAGYEEDTTVLADAEVASFFSGHSGVSTEGQSRRREQRQEGRGGRPRPRRARSAPPVSSSGSEGEEEEEEGDGWERQGRGRGRRGYRVEEEEQGEAAVRRQRRRERRERRRWEYYRCVCLFRGARIRCSSRFHASRRARLDLLTLTHTMDKRPNQPPHVLWVRRRRCLGQWVP